MADVPAAIVVSPRPSLWSLLRPTLVEMLSSKKALAMLSTLLVIVASPIVGRFGYEIDPEKLALYVGIIAAYVVGQGLADHGSTAAQKSAQTSAVAMLPDGPIKLAALHALAGIAPDSTKTADSIAQPPVSGEIKS